MKKRRFSHHAQIAVQREFLGHVADARARRGRARGAGPAGHAQACRALAGSRPHSMRKVVDLPAPLAPSRPKTSPRSTSKLTPLTA